MHKLYYIANVRLPTEKAHGIQIVKMCEAFTLLGYDVELVIPNRKTSIKTNPFEYYGIERNFNIKRLPTLDIVKFGRYGFLIQSLTFAINAGLYSVLKSGFFYTRDDMNALVLKTLGKKVAWEVHMDRKNIISRILTRLNIPIIVITQGLRELYKEKGVPNNRLLVAHDAVDLSEFSNLSIRSEARKILGLPEEKLIISYIGKYKTLGKSKGVEDIIAPFANALKTHSNFFLLIVGPDTSEVEELKNICREFSISEDSFSLISHVEHRKIPLYMKASDVLLMVYPNTTHYANYMSPLKLFEYMASRTAILTSDLPSLREVLSDESALFFVPEKEDSLLEALDKIGKNPSILESKSSKAFKDVQEYTWEKRAQTILKFI